MGYTETLSVVVYGVTIFGTILGLYVTYKIYTKEGFR